jgi:hypothetical protein
MVVGSLLGIAIGWNATDIGAVAAETASACGIAVASVGLFTTARFVTHFLAEVPGGRLIDRLGARRVCLIGAFSGAGAALSMAAPVPVLGAAARAVTGTTAVALSLVAGCAGSALLGTSLSVPTAVVGCLLLGIGGGIPSRPPFTGAAGVRPDAPAAAVGVVNAMAAAVVRIFTPLVGLTFSLPGDRRIGFAAAGVAWLIALVTLPDRRALTGS